MFLQHVTVVAKRANEDCDSLVKVDQVVRAAERLASSLLPSTGPNRIASGVVQGQLQTACSASSERVVPDLRTGKQGNDLLFATGSTH